MENKQLAEHILQLVGGNENVSGVTHCATRLRVSVNDVDAVQKNKLEDLNGVLQAVQSGNQTQIVIGNKVNNVYKEFVELVDVKETQQENSTKKSQNIFSRFFDYISGSLTPLIPVFAGAGMIKAILVLLTMTNILSVESGAYAVLSAAGNGIFYFFPIIIGFTASQKLKVNPYIGAAIGTALLEPNYTNLLGTGVETDFLGIPIVLSDYASSIFPILIAILVYSYIEKYLNRFIPESIQIFMVPMLSLMIMVPFTVLVFGPFGVFFSGLIGNFINSLINFNTVIAGLVIGAGWIYIVSLGLHWVLMPIAIQNLTNFGSDQILAMAGGTIFASLGIALGVLIKTKDKDLKAFAASSAMSQFFAGIGEPILYGLVFRYKKLLGIFTIMGAIGGALVGLFDVRLIAFAAFTNVFTIASYSPLLSVIMIWIVVTLVTAGIVYVLWDGGVENTKQTSKDSDEVKTKTTISAGGVASPVSGKLIPLDTIDDSVFSSGIMGETIAVNPTEGQVVAPFDGVITVAYPTKHAIGITSTDGVEMLIHIGIDTFKLEGKAFTSHIKEGDQVTKGQLLVEFDINQIIENQLEPTTMIVITNSDEVNAHKSNATNNVIKDKDLIFQID